VFTVSIQNFRNVAILKCQGRLVRGEETGLLCAAIRLPATAILDLAAVESIDAAGIGVLISLQAAGIYLTLLNPSDSVRNVLRLTGVDSIFAIAESLDEAIDAAPQEGKPLAVELRESAHAAVPLAS
jgi:anti-anti-sigma factor